MVKYTVIPANKVNYGQLRAWFSNGYSGDGGKAIAERAADSLNGGSRHKTAFTWDYGPKEDGWAIVESTEKYIVWNTEGSTPKVIHTSKDAAKKEAERLSGLNPNQKFYWARLEGGYETVVIKELKSL